MVKDTELSGDIARMRMQEAIAEGAVAIVGPAASGEVSATYPTARDAMVPMMSPSSTLAALSKPDVNDGGSCSATSPTTRPRASRPLYLTGIRDPKVTSIAVVYEDTDYGRGLRDGVEQAMDDFGGQVTKSVAYPQMLTNPQAVIDELATGQAPTMTLLIALGGNGIAITNAWASSGKLPQMQWLFTDGSRSSDFLTQTPDKVIGMCGTAATFPVNGLQAVQGGDRGAVRRGRGSDRARSGRAGVRAQRLGRRPPVRARHDPADADVRASRSAASTWPSW